MPRFANWSGLVASRPAEVRAVADVDHVVDAVRVAGERAWPVRVAGTTHSHSPLLHNDHGMILTTDDMAGILAVDGSSATARIAGGTKLSTIGPALWDAGFSLANQGDVDVQSVAGLTGTGVHGTGPTLPSISASVVDSTIVTASGDVVVASSDPATLEAARLHLGALGVVVDVTLALVPAYHLHERHWRARIDAVVADLDHLVHATRHFEFFWYPVDDLAYAKALEPHPGPADPLDGVRGEYVDRAYRVFPSVRSERHTEMEYSLPAEAGPDVFRAIRDLMRREFYDVTWPVEYRTVAADDGWISPARGRATVTISVHEGVDRAHEPFFGACEEIFVAHGGRPHWGKCHYLSATDLAGLYGEGWDRYWQVQRRLDPDGRFLNPWLAGLAPW